MTDIETPGGSSDILNAPLPEPNSVELTELEANFVKSINSNASQLSALLQSDEAALSLDRGEPGILSPNPLVCNVACNGLFPPLSPISYEGVVGLIGIMRDKDLLVNKRDCEGMVRDTARFAAILSAIFVDPAVISIIVDVLGTYCGDCACDRNFG
jgi:hypothetical protein